MSNPSRAIHYRSISPVDGHSPHFLSALQVIAHVIGPLRKALIHFYLTAKQHTNLEKIEWRTLQALGKLMKELTSADFETSQMGSENNSHRDHNDDKDDDDNDGDNDDDDDDDDDEPASAVDPLELYMILDPCLRHLKKSTEPKDSTQALQILLETIQICARALPLTSHLWVAMLDISGLGLMAKASIVGKCPLIEDHQILQRTQKETILEWCPLVLPKRDTLEEALREHCSRQPHTYDFDKKPFQFEARIPLLSPEQAKDMDTANWTTTKTLRYTALTSYLFLGIDRRSPQTGTFDETEVAVPTRLDLTKLCENSIKGTREYELVGGILHDEGDYVALLKNTTIEDPEDEAAWTLMESEEVIPMTESDALDFLKGEDEGSPCGTMAVYRRCDNHPELTQLLSDIIISQVSGTLDANTDFYYEEEVIED